MAATSEPPIPFVLSIFPPLASIRADDVRPTLVRGISNVRAALIGGVPNVRAALNGAAPNVRAALNGGVPLV